MEKSASAMKIRNDNDGSIHTTRKRMSLIVRYNDEIILMSKGADSIILPRIKFFT
jgi:hypothetical protein